MSIKLGANKDVTKDAKKDAIEVEKLGTKMDVKRDEKKYAIDIILGNCTIKPSLALDCSPQLGKNYTKIWH